MNSTKSDILLAARELFLDKGYETSSLQDIMKAVGISKGGIYHHFASKEEILSELITLETAPLLDGAKRIFNNPELSIREKFLEWMECKTSFYRDRYSLLRRVFVGESDIALRFRIIDEMKAHIKPLVEKAIAASDESIPHIRETANLILCSHELIFSYGLSEIETEQEFESYLKTIRHIFGKVFS